MLYLEVVIEGEGEHHDKHPPQQFLLSRAVYSSNHFASQELEVEIHGWAYS